MNKIYTKNDTNKMSYEEFGSILEKLISEIENSQIKFDAVAPILRSGAIPGMMIAVRLKIFNVVPVYLKNNYKTGVIDQMFEIPKIELPENSNILICENNTFSGKTAIEAIKILKLEYPTANLYYATIAKTHGGPEDFEGINEYFYGVKTNEMFAVSNEEAEQLNLRQNITIYPWENIDDELSDINAM